MTTIHSGQLKSGPWLLEASHHVAARLRLPDVPSKGLDALGFDQRKLNGNFMSWMNELSDQDKHEGNQWYPTGNDWGHHAAELHNVHPDKVFGVMSKTSPQRDWYSNLGDTENVVGNHRYSPENIVKPGGISGNNNLQQALRVMDAPDDPESIHGAFLGTKNVARKGQPVAVPRDPGDLPKTYDFMRTLRNPEEGGAHNYLQQPGVVDSWMGRSMLWSKKAWDEAQAGGKPLTWPGQGTGEGLDKHLPVKKPNPDTGRWEVVGTRPPSARDVAARVTGMAGGYDRMRNAMRNGAAAHNMPFTHGAQAAVWKAISGNENPSGVSSGEDPFYIEHPGDRWDEMWNRRAGKPTQSGVQVAHRTAAHGSREVEDSLDEGWGTPEDFAAILKHVSSIPAGWDAWENRPKMVILDPHRTSSWYITAEDKDDDSTTSAPAGNEDPQQPTSAAPINIPGVRPQTMTMQFPAVTPMTMNPNLPHGMTNMGELGPSNFGGGGSAPSAPPRVPHTEAVPSYGGGTPPPDAPHVPPAPAGAGGVAAATALAQGANGNPYDYGGAGNGHYDCSGYQSDIYNALTGKPLGQRSFSTTSDFGALGFQPGFDPKSKYNIGVIPQAGMNGHMVGELNGVPLESGGAANKTQYGGSAAGPLNPEFPVHYHLPDSMIVAPAPVAAPAAASHVGPAGKTGRNWYLTATDWGAMPDAQVMGPSAPPGYHPGATPTSPWTNSAPVSSVPVSSGSGSSSGPTPPKPSNPGGSGENITTPSGPTAPPSGPTPPSSPGTPSKADEKAYAQSLFPQHGWGPEQMGPLDQLWNHESGDKGNDNVPWNPAAHNQSGAEGIWQGMPYTPGYTPPGTDWHTQIEHGENYIQQHGYGNPTGAWNQYYDHPGNEGSYDQGGWLPPGTHLVHNDTGEPERVLSPEESHAIHSGKLKSGPWLLEASRHHGAEWYITADDSYGDTESGEQDSDTGGEGYGGKPPDA